MPEPLRMPMIVTATAQEAAGRAATVLANHIVGARASRGRALVAVSGGSTPWVMLDDLATRALPWKDLHIVQVDERMAPDGDPDRNLTHLRKCLGGVAAQIHPIDAGNDDPEAAATAYAAELAALARARPPLPPVLDLVHLGLGEDGHTASLVPGDPVLEVVDVGVAATGVYGGHRRVTLTYPVLAAARRVLWLATGEGKAAMVARLVAGDRTIPAGRVSSARALLVVDEAAASALAR